MILYKDMRYCTNSDHPNDDWVGDADYVIPDGSELAEKIIGLFPNFKIVPDDDGGIADVAAAEYVPAETMPTDHERLEALETAFIEFVAGSEVE